MVPLLVGLVATPLLPSCTLGNPTPGTMMWEWASDGCSKSPDIAVECCDEHDMWYRRGGYDSSWSERARKAADLRLYVCMLEHDVPGLLARSYYTAVREAGGSAWNSNRGASRK